MEESDNRKISELSIEELVGLIADVVEARLILYPELINANNLYWKVRERLDEINEIICTEDSSFYSLGSYDFFAELRGEIESLIKGAFERISELSERDKELFDIYNEAMVAYSTKFSSQYTLKREPELPAQTQLS